MKRVIVGVLAVGLLGPAVVPAALAQDQGPPLVWDMARAYAVMPPGQDGTITAQRFLTGNFGPNYSNQLDMYAAIVDDDHVTDDELGDYFRSMQFGPGQVSGMLEPKDGVRIYRGEFGIPSIYAESLEDASFGLGYVTAQDRLFQMDVFRHAARGELAGFIGPGTDDKWLVMDIETRREGYTEEEVQQMFDELDDRFDGEGRAIQEGLEQYAEGVNAYIAQARLDPGRRPFEYEGTGNPPPTHPQPWSPLDTLFIVVLQLRVFGESAGGELENAGLFAHLVETMGEKRGRAAYADFIFQNDPRSPVTIPPGDGDFTTQRLGPVNWDSVAIPDKAEEEAEEEEERRALVTRALESLGFRKPASNALVVAAQKSATGNPMLLGGPQVGHAVPSFFLEIDVHAPGVDFRGAAVPGTSALIPLGRGRDYAWTLTTGYSDAVDTRAELLCDPGGGEPTLESNAYVFKGECIEMESREETIQIKPPPTDPGPPSSETHTFYRTLHGPVFTRALVDGKPVAFVRERFFWKKEIDSVPPFYRWNTKVRSLEDFAAAARDFTMSFNVFYADHENIAYFHLGEYPRRVPGMHPSLPTWGTGEWEWRGRRPYSTHPKVVNPKQGWLANWNNKPTLSWNNMDSAKWGTIQRSGLLIERMQELTRRGKVGLADLADVIRDVATRDARGVFLGPEMLRRAARVAGDREEIYQTGLDVVREWIRQGAHRRNRDDDEDTMDDGPALAIFDLWYSKLVHAIFDDELGEKGYPLVGPVTNYNPSSGGGFWFDFSTYLGNLFDGGARRAMLSRNYCNNTGSDTRETCGDLISETLMAALKELAEEDGADVSRWTKPAENIVWEEQGAGSVREIPWQNRGSQNHLVEITGRAPAPSGRGSRPTLQVQGAEPWFGAPPAPRARYPR